MRLLAVWLGCATLGAIVASCSDRAAEPAQAVDAGASLDAGTDASVQDASDASAVIDGGDAFVEAAALDASIDATFDGSIDAAVAPDVFIPDAQTGPFADAPAACPPEAVSSICARLAANCGSLTTVDVCGESRTVTCGTCVSGSVCGGGAAPNICAACASETDSVFCTRLGKNCGSVSGTDNCANSRTSACGICGGGQSCSASNVCQCVAESVAAFCSRLAKDCGTVTDVDNCGASRVAACGACGGSATCGGAGSANVCGEVPVCAPPSATPRYTAVASQLGPAPFAQAVCSTAQVSSLVSACFGVAGSPAACNAWLSSNTACKSCALKPHTATALGPIVSYAADVDATSNPLGTRDDSVLRGAQACLDHYRSGCGAAFLSLQRCLEASCDQNPACSTPSALSVCRAAASSGVCAAVHASAFDPVAGSCRGVVSYAASSSAILPGDSCLPFAGELDSDPGHDAFLVRLVTTFCGN